MKKTIYFISDHTGLTVEGLARTLLSQFDLKDVEYRVKPYIDSVNKAEALLVEILQHPADERLVFSSLTDKAVAEVFAAAEVDLIDLFAAFIPRLEKKLGQKASGKTGLAHSARDYHNYMLRIDALNFALTHDDGLNNKHYQQAEVVLVGVSRSGKTPSCLYLAIQFGIQAANFPITEDDLSDSRLPKPLVELKPKLFGLLIDPRRLHEIRSERLPNSRYASLAQCRHEISQVERLFQKERIPYLNTTSLSIEEISTQIVVQCGIDKKF